MGRKNKKRDKRKVSLRSKLTFAVIMNYLNPGDSLFIYTDGATEATNASGERFFGERLLAALNEVKDGKPEEILEHMKARIDAFVDGAPQFDDLTMLAVTYHGRAGSTEVPE